MATNTDSNNQPTGAPALPSEPSLALAEQASLVTTSVETLHAPGGDVVVKPAQLDTPESDAAIDDIVAKEADEALAAQDAGIAAAQDQAEGQTAEPEKRGHPVFWFIIVLLVVLIGVAAYVLTSPGLELPFST